MNFFRNRVISTDAWHYHFLTWIRSLYGGCPPNEAYSTVCPYVQTLIWGCVACALLFPIMILGWLCGRMSAMVFAIQGKRFDRAIGWLENTRWGKFVEQTPRKFKEAPLLYGAVMGINYGIAIVAGVAILFALGLILWNLNVALPYIGNTIMTVGWSVMWFLGESIGAGISWTGYGLAWFFTNGAMWLGILKWGGIGLAVLSAALTVAMGIGYLFFKITKSKRGERISAWFTSKWKNYYDARGARLDRLVHRKMEREQARKWKCTYCSYMSSHTFKQCESCLTDRPGNWLSDKWKKWVDKISGRYIKIKGNGVHVMGFFCLIGEYFVSRKEKYCAKVTFVTPAYLKSQAEEAATDKVVEDLQNKEEIAALDRKISDNRERLAAGMTLDPSFGLNSDHVRSEWKATK